jgi:hypothetical protein
MNSSVAQFAADAAAALAPVLSNQPTQPLLHLMSQ